MGMENEENYYSEVAIIGVQWIFNVKYVFIDRLNYILQYKIEDGKTAICVCVFIGIL